LHPVPLPKPEETALIIVNGQQFGDWETVMVQGRYNDAFSYFNVPDWAASGNAPLIDLFLFCRISFCYQERRRSGRTRNNHHSFEPSSP
jgi:hypothetical protein